MNLLAAAVLIVTVGAVLSRQLLLRGPPIWLIFLAGAFAMVAVGALSVSQAGTAIASNLSILVFLFSLFIFAAGLEQAGALDHLARWILGKARRPSDLPFVLFAAVGIVSAFVINDALVLVGVPVVFAVARRLKVSAEPLLLTLAFSVTVGSVLTPFGNPQNLLVSLGSGMSAPVATFLRYLLLPTIVNLVLGGWYLRRVFKHQLADGNEEIITATPAVALFPQGRLFNLGRRFPAVILFPVTMAVMITADVVASLTSGVSVPLYAVALGGAIAVLLLTPGRSELFARVDWSIIVLFAALFVVVAGAVSGGLLSEIQSVIPIPGPGQPVTATAAIIATSLGGSQLVSNVPWVALQIPLLYSIGYGASTPWAWVALAAGSTLAGNLTLLGAASNLIVVEQAERAGVAIGLARFVKVGLPMTAMTVAVLFAFLVVGL
ncbi:MAG: SLC13 family permease [Thermoplasmata archaeon]